MHLWDSIRYVLCRNERRISFYVLRRFYIEHFEIRLRTTSSSFTKKRRSKESTERKNCNLTKFILHWDVPWKLNRTRPKEEKLSLPKDMNARAHSRLLQLESWSGRFKSVFWNVFSFVSRIENDIDMLLGNTRSRSMRRQACACARQTSGDKPNSSLVAKRWDHFLFVFSLFSYPDSTFFFLLRSSNFNHMEFSVSDMAYL